jgi:hypothetical protein
MSAKPKKIIVNQTIYKDDTFEKDAISSQRILTETTFNDAGQIIHEIRFGADGMVESIVTNTYNEAGKLLTREHQDEQEQSTEKLEFFYNEAGNAEKHFKIYTDGSQDVIEYKYDSSNQLISKRVIDDEGEVEEITRYAYSGNKLILEEIKDGTGEIVSTNKYSFDDNGNETVHETSNPEGYLKIVNTYNAQNKRITTVKIDEDGEIVEETSIEEDEESKTIKMIENSPSGTVFYNILLDNQGRQLMQEEYDENEDLLSRVEREYDESGNLIQSKAIVYRPEFGTYQYYAITNQIVF